MGFKCGLVGLPNIGKSTLFNALTRARVAADNYAFCTIEPNLGQVAVPDPRLAELAKLTRPQKIIPAAMEFVDIAGLVAGAAQGEGLGNRFLAHIREVDAIAHVVRAFADDEITHISAELNPLGDMETVNTELILADITTAQKAYARAEKNSKSGDREQQAMRDLLKKVLQHLDGGNMLRALVLDAEQQRALKPYGFLTAKPTLYIANVGENDAAESVHADAIAKATAAAGAQSVAVCAKIEQELTELDANDGAAFLRELGWTEPGLHRVIRAGYAALGLHTFFTAGPKEARAWTLPVGARAVDAAAVIHSDFAAGFIRAETISYDDYINFGGEQAARDAGKLRLEGRDYVVADGDVMHFRFHC